MPDYTWQDIGEGLLGIGRQVADFQFAKQAARQQASLARKMARASMAPMSMGYSAGMPTLGMGYAQQAPSGMQLPVQNAGFDWGPLVPNPLANALGFGSAPTNGGGAGCFRTSTPGAPRVTPCKEIQATGPDGKTYSWVYRGRPVLYSGDLATCKRVAKILRRSGRKAGSRFR